MANIRTEILKRVFKKGVESVSKKERQRVLKEAFEALKEEGAPIMYRLEEQPERLMKSGFRRSNFIAPGEPKAMYWAHTPEEAKVLKFGTEYTQAQKGTKPTELVEGIILPETETRRYGHKEFSRLIDKAEIEAEEWYPPSLAYREGLNAKLTKKLKKDADIVFAPDVMQSPDIEQIAQLRRGKVLGKIGDKYRILGVAGALGGGMGLTDLFDVPSAEASPYGKVAKEFVKRTSKGAVSSTLERIKGEELWGKKIKNIVKGKGDWRFIQFTDGTERGVTKDVAREIVEDIKATKAQKDFLKEPEVNKLEIAGRKLEWYKKHQPTFTTKKEQTEWLQKRQTRSKEMGLETTDYVWVDSEKMWLPRYLAERLEVAGRVKIKKGK